MLTSNDIQFSHYQPIHRDQQRFSHPATMTQAWGAFNALGHGSEERRSNGVPRDVEAGLFVLMEIYPAGNGDLVGN